MRLDSQVIITTHVDDTIAKLQNLAVDGEKLVIIKQEGNFLVDDVKLAIEKAYMASKERTIIVLAADNFSAIVQNRLLKIIEEPPPQKEFILLFPSKATILPTIRSRLPITILDETVDTPKLGLDMMRLDIRAVYEFIQEHSRINASKAKELVEQIGKIAIQTQKYNLDNKTLNVMRDSIKALDRGSPPSFILTGLLLKLLARKKR